MPIRIDAGLVRAGWWGAATIAAPTALLLALAFAPARAADPTAFTSAFVASWNLNHGEYLVDIGQYLEAIEAFDTATEMAEAPEVRGEAQLQKASVLAVFLDAPEDALRVYDEVLAKHPGSAAADMALFRAGMTLFDDGEYARAAQYFERYLEQYPQGKSRGSAEFLLRQSRAQAAAAPAPLTVAPATPTPPTAVASPISTMSSAAGATPTRRAPVAATAVPSPQPPPPAAAPLPPVARVPSAVQVRTRVFKGRRKIRIEADGPLTITPPIASGRSVDLTARDGLVSGGSQPGVREVSIRADSPLTVRDDRTARHYRGSITLRADGDTLLIVNHASLEDYVYGVVTKESPSSWPNEALKAQAIASRTYALYQVQHRRDRTYDMVDDEGSQVYGGVDGETASGRRAVDETRGMVLLYRDRPIYAMFTSNTGWHTGDPKFVFDQPLAYLQAVEDPYSPGEQLGRWTRKFDADEVQSALAKIGVRLGPIRAIRPQVSCPSGRIIRVSIEDDSGARVMRTRPTLGRALNLPEILLDIRRDGEQFIFAGGGFGHGIGLSQWGAKNMAGKGLPVQDILAFYYRGTQLTQISE